MYAFVCIRMSLYVNERRDDIGWSAVYEIIERYGCAPYDVDKKGLSILFRVLCARREWDVSYANRYPRHEQKFTNKNLGGGGDKMGEGGGGSSHQASSMMAERTGKVMMLISRRVRGHIVQRKICGYVAHMVCMQDLRIAKKKKKLYGWYVNNCCSRYGLLFTICMFLFCTIHTNRKSSTFTTDFC